MLITARDGPVADPHGLDCIVNLRRTDIAAKRQALQITLSDAGSDGTSDEGRFRFSIPNPSRRRSFVDAPHTRKPSIDPVMAFPPGSTPPCVTPTSIEELPGPVSLPHMVLIIPMRILLTAERNLKYNLITSTSELLHRCYLGGIDSDQPREDLAWIAGMGKFEQVAVRLSLGLAFSILVTGKVFLSQREAGQAIGP